MTELAVGVYAARTFRVASDGQLLPVSAHRHYRGATAWHRGRCIAACLAYPGSTHTAPGEACECGIYGFASVATLRQQYRQAQAIIAIIALEGTVLEGEQGYRAQAARVVALWAAPRVIDADLRAKIADRLDDDAVVYDDLDTMMANYPGLQHAETTTSGETIERADVVVAATLPQRQLVAAARTTVAWWARVALWVVGFGWWPAWDHLATSSNFDLDSYPIVDGIMAIPRWVSQFAVALGSPTAMWWGILPALVVAAVYTVPAARGVASKFVAPAEGLVQVTVGGVVIAALVGAPSIAHSPASWIVAAALTVLAVTIRPVSSARRLRGHLL